MQRTLRIFPQQFLGRRAYSFRSTRFNPQLYVETEFEKKWRTMPEHERNAIEESFQELERGDWRHLTKDQIRNNVKDPYEGRKLFVGVVGVMAFAYGVFKFVRSYAQPPPRTHNPEYKTLSEKMLKEAGAIPLGFKVDEEGENEVTFKTVKL